MTSAKDKMAETKKHETARQAVDRLTMDAIVTLFLLRDGLVLPDELEEMLTLGEDAACRQLITYAELSGLLKDGVSQKAHERQDVED